MLPSIRFAVYDPVGKNAMYARGAGKRLYITKVGEAFMHRIAYAALAARANSAWPRDLKAPKQVRVTAQIYNTRHDVGACMTAIKDALEHILYENDRVACNGPEEFPIVDGGGRRVEVTVELLA